MLPIRGVRNDVPVTFEEGGAVPGDRIVGVLTEGEGIRIFQIHSPRLKDYEHERWIDVTWDVDPDAPERFPAKLSVTALNEPGTLAQIAQLIGEADGNIDNVRMVRRAPDFTEMAIEVEVWDLDHLTQIIAGLKGKSVVSKVERTFSLEQARFWHAHRPQTVHGSPDTMRPPICALASTSTTSPPSAMRAAGVIPTRFAPRIWPSSAGADGITAHLREDRRHISDADIARLKAELTRPLNLEMAATDEMLAIALRHVPHACCLVPEKREEQTTEGGLDVVRGENHLRHYVEALKGAGIRVSLFIEPDAKAIEASARLGAQVVELHTGAYCERALADDAAGLGARAGPARARRPRLQRLPGWRCTPATASPSTRWAPWPASPEIVELNIGHFLIGEAIFSGLGPAIAHMRVRDGRGPRRPGAQADAAAMIVGIGNDVIDIRRIEKTIERYGERFLNRVFTDAERARSDGKAGPRRVLCQAVRGQGGLRQGAGNGVAQAACSGRTWAWSTCARAGPTLLLTGGAARAAQAH